MKNIPPYSLLILILFTSCLTRNKTVSQDKQIESLLSQMTLEEKIGMLHGNTMFSSSGVPRLGIPDLQYSDGPHGVRLEGEPYGWKSAEWTNDACTYLPALTALSATWNRELAHLYGEVLGAECKARGKHVSLAPGVNIHRSLLNGRNWEYFSEDPYLSGELAVPYIQGVQSQGVGSCVKHFALNSQAYNQYTVSSEVDDRTLHEIYLPAFEAAIQRGGAMTVMAAYNKVRGLWCTESSYLLDSLLRGELGFDGMVVSDWNAVHNTERTALCGMDVEMGTNIKGNGKEMFKQYYLADPLLQKVQNGEIPEEAVNRKVRNILKLMLRLDLIGKAPYDTTGMAAKLATPAHCSIAREIAEESFVLLRNSNHMLPLNPAHYKKIAVIGANAKEVFARGGGSTKLKAKYEITPLEGLHNFLGDSAQIEYAAGYKLNKKAYKVGHWFTNEFETSDPQLIKQAVATAAKAELVIYIGGLSHDHGSDCEGYDKPDLKLPYGQDQLLEALLEVNPNTVVVLMAGGPVELGKWYEHANALLHCSFIGMEGGNALARVLFGEVNPSGKLTTTWCKRLEDMPDHVFGEYPGNDTVRFKEGLMVGYRYFDTYQIAPQFEFGYGLSYTSFEYSDLKMNPIWKDPDKEFDVSFSITNTGKRYGQEIAQLYIHQQQCSVKRPVKELKGFEKVSLEAGESRQVTLKLPRRALQYYDVISKSWKDEPGIFTIQVGASSRDIRLQKDFELKK